MFKAPKKAKKRKQVLSTVADSSDEEERDTARAVPEEEAADVGDGGGGSIGALEAAQMKIKARKDKQKKKQKNQKRSGSSAGTGGGVSFNAEEHEEEIDGFNDGAAQGSSRRDRKKQRKKDDKKKRKKRSGGMGFGGATMSFHDDEEEEDAAAESASASAGIGYTGYSASASGRDDNDDQDTTGGGSLYGAAALEALRSKQKVFVAPRGDVNSKEGGDEDKSKQDAPTDTATKMDVEQPDASAGTGTSKPKDPELGDGQTNFIPLDGSSIVAGDDALAYMEEEDDEREGMANPEAEAARRKHKRNLMGTDRLSNASGGDMGVGVGNDSVLGGLGDAKDGEIDAGGRQWEEEVARRAGIASRGQQEGRQTTSSSPAATLTTMRSTISKTLTHLRQRREDLESSHDRRQNELQGVEDDLRRQEEDLRAGGSAFEYYQDLRVDIADWVGALRNLSTKVDTITDAIREQEVDLAERRRLRLRQREDDAAAILQSKSLLDSVIGRQVQLSDDNNVAPAVDEFGRDIQSAEALARERRIVRRRRVEKESLKRVNKRLKAEVHVVQCDSDEDLSDNEIEELGQRIDALEEALLLAKDELDDRYCSLAALQDLFMSWDKHSPEDYRRCYAKLSFGDMAAVLVKAETCTKINTLQCTKDSDICNVADFDWVLTASSFESSESPQEEKSSKGEASSLPFNEGGDDRDEKLVCAISRKVVLPYFLLLMGEGANGEMGDPLYDPFSSRQTELIKGLYLFLKNMLKSDANAIQRSAQSILDVFKATLDKMAVILVKPDALTALGGEGTNSGTDDDQSEMESVTCSILEQANRLRKFISNAAALSSLFVHVGSGGPQRELASFILLEAIAARLLPVLSPLQNADACGNQKTEKILQMVWNDIKEAGWLDDEALMLQTTPIHAALSNK